MGWLRGLWTNPRMKDERQSDSQPMTVCASDDSVMTYNDKSITFTGDLAEGYTHEVALVVCMMRYYSELDMTEYETEESWNALYDILESTGVLDGLYDLLIEDLDKVRRIYEKIKDAATQTFERRHSLSYRAGKAFGSLLTDEDLTATLAKAEGVNSAMIDMLGVFQQVQGKKSLLDGSVVPFAKRDKRE